MDISVTARDDPHGHTIVDVTGDLTARTVGQLQENLVRLIVADSFFLIVDLTKVEKLDASAVLPVLEDAATRVQPYRGWVRVVDPSGKIAASSAKLADGAALSIYPTLSLASST